MKVSGPLFDQHLAQTTPYPIGLDIVSASGIYLHASDGTKYIDLISGVGVSALGHGNEKVKTAIKKQVEQHLHVMVYGEYLQKAQINLAARLCRHLPDTLDCCYFVNSGTEANEAALKLAKRITKRTRIISCYGAYHGSTHGSLSLSSNEVKKAPFRPLLPEVDFIRFNEPEDLSLIKSDVACVFMETIQGDAGVRIPDIAYMRALRKKCNETGALLVLDEIQCGLGRSGSWFAFEQFDITPDILTLGKALGAGMPIGALISSRAHMSTLSFDPMLGHITTFGGHPVVCAAANAGLEVLEEASLIDQVHLKGQLFYDLLKDHPAIKHIRYRGLFFAIDMENAEVVQKVVDHCLANGLIAFWFLSCPWAFRIAPPFVISEDEITQACSIILNAMDSII